MQRTKQENFLVSFCAFFPYGSDNKANTFVAKTNEAKPDNLQNVDLKIKFPYFCIKFYTPYGIFDKN